jgi:hypothetical protein
MAMFDLQLFQFFFLFSTIKATRSKATTKNYISIMFMERKFRLNDDLLTCDCHCNDEMKTPLKKFLRNGRLIENH